MTVQEEAKAYRKFRNEEALEYCRKQSMLEQMVGNETWKHYDTASKALEELEQYRALGTVEELKKAKEKQIPKTPCIEGDGYCPEGNLVYDTWICPNCEEHYEIDYHDYDYCPKCGQKINREIFY